MNEPNENEFVNYKQTEKEPETNPNGVEWNEREILVDIEPRNKEFRVQVGKETSVEELITTLVSRCQDEGINMSDWGSRKVGQSNVSFCLMRKATGNTAIAPTVTFQELFPVLDEQESFKLDARAQVGH